MSPGFKSMVWVWSTWPLTTKVPPPSPPKPRKKIIYRWADLFDNNINSPDDICEVDNKSSRWADLPVKNEILSEIARRLPCSDLHHCSFVCKNWLAFNEELKRRLSSLPVIEAFCVKQYRPPNQMLLVCQSKFFDSQFQQNCCIQTPLPQGNTDVVIDHCFPCYYGCFSGWFLFKGQDLPDGRLQFFTFNPFNSQTVVLPPLDGNFSECSIFKALFSASPTCSDCVIFLVWQKRTKFSVNICNLKDETWTSYGDLWFGGGAFVDVTYADGVFCCSVKIDSELRLIAFDPLLRTWDVMDSSYDILSEVDNKNSGWADLAVNDNILHEVARRLPCSDLHHSSFVCKKWLAFSEELKRRVSSLPVIKAACGIKRFRHRIQMVCRAKFFDFQFQQNCCIETPLPQGNRDVVIDPYSPDYYGSFSGWFLFKGRDLPDGRLRFFAFNPFNSQSVVLPPLDGKFSECSRFGALFSASPTCSDCVIFVLWQNRTGGYSVKLCNPKDKTWTTSYGDLWCGGGAFLDAIYADGIFYCAVKTDSELRLYAFDALLRTGDVIDISASLSGFDGFHDDGYLVISDPGELIFVTLHDIQDGLHDIQDGVYLGDCLHIYQFNLLQKDWTTTASLGNRILILNAFSSYVIPAVGVTSRFHNTVFRYCSKKMRGIWTTKEPTYEYYTSREEEWRVMDHEEDS